MQISVPIETLRQRKLFLATPMYGGSCAGMYAKSVADLSAMCAANGIELRSYFLFNESLIPRARNYCVDEFMRSGFTHFIFLDADIGFARPRFADGSWWTPYDPVQQIGRAHV